jgi:hypothetical protein
LHTNKRTAKPSKPLNCGFFGVNLLLFANKGQIMNKTADYVNRLVDGNALNDRLSAKDKTLEKVRAALSEGIFNKWQSYSFVFSLVAKRKITMREVCEIAEVNGIPSGVIKMRRNDLKQLNKVMK